MEPNAIDWAVVKAKLDAIEADANTTIAKQNEIKAMVNDLRTALNLDVQG